MVKLRNSNHNSPIKLIKPVIGQAQDTSDGKRLIEQFERPGSACDNRNPGAGYGVLQVG